MDNKSSIREALYGYVKNKYNNEPEYPWKKFSEYAVFRHTDNKKWYALIMNLPKSKLGLKGDDDVDIINLKLKDTMLRDMLIQQEGYFPGYHMSKGNWISILLDGTVAFEEVCGMIDMSYAATASKKNMEKVRPPKEWLIPANPKYYDVEHAFDNTDEIYWKQGAAIKTGDTVYLYVAAPVSAILFKCVVVEADILRTYKDDNLTIRKQMKIKLLHRYDPTQFTFNVLKNDYDVFAIRAPRGIPYNLSRDLSGMD